MPYTIQNGQMVDVPQGYNPAPFNAYQAQAGVAATGPGAQPGMNPWQSRNLPGIGGQGIDPRFQSNSTYGQNTSYDDMVRAATGQQAAYRGPANFGMAGQQYGAGTGPFAAPMNLTNQNRALTADGGIPAPPMTPGVGTQTPQAITRQTPGAPAGMQMSQPPGLQQPPPQWTPTGPYTQNYTANQQQAPWWAMAAPPYNPLQGMGRGQPGMQQGMPGGGMQGNVYNPGGGYQFGGGMQPQGQPDIFNKGMGNFNQGPSGGMVFAGAPGMRSGNMLNAPGYSYVPGQGMVATGPLSGGQGMTAPGMPPPGLFNKGMGNIGGGGDLSMLNRPAPNFPGGYQPGQSPQMQGGGGMAQGLGPQMQMPNLNSLLQQFQRPMAPQGMGGMGGMGGDQQQLMQQLARYMGMG